MKFIRLSLLLGLASACLASHAFAQSDEALPALVQVLQGADDPQLQLDILKGMSEGLKGRRGVKMPAGWEELSAKLGKSANVQVRELAQSLSLMFGSASALTALRAQLVDTAAAMAARQSALESLLAARDATLA